MSDEQEPTEHFGPIYEAVREIVYRELMQTDKRHNTWLDASNVADEILNKIFLAGDNEMTEPTYMLRLDGSANWETVTKERFIQAERAAGFRPKGGGDGCATAGFSGSGVQGRVVYAEENYKKGGATKEAEGR